MPARRNATGQRAETSADRQSIDRRGSAMCACLLANARRADPHRNVGRFPTRRTIPAQPADTSRAPSPHRRCRVDESATARRSWWERSESTTARRGRCGPVCGHRCRHPVVDFIGNQIRRDHAQSPAAARSRANASTPFRVCRPSTALPPAALIASTVRNIAGPQTPGAVSVAVDDRTVHPRIQYGTPTSVDVAARLDEGHRYVERRRDIRKTGRGDCPMSAARSSARHGVSNTDAGQPPGTADPS